MACEWKSADGQYCKFCECYEWGKISELEAYIGYPCRDCFDVCEIAYAFSGYEETEEEEAEQKRVEKEAEARRNKITILDEPESTSSSPSFYSGPSLIKLYDFRDFFSGLFGGGIMSAVLKVGGFLALLALSVMLGVRAMQFVALPQNESLSNILQFALLAGIPTLFVILFGFVEWRALAVPIYFLVVGGVNLVFPQLGDSGILTALTIIGLAVAIPAGVLPGLLTWVLLEILPQFVEQTTAFYLFLILAIPIPSAIFGSVYNRLLDRLFRKHRQRRGF